MAFEWDAADRAAFDEALVEHILGTFPEATIHWIEYGKRLRVDFPDGCTTSIWEPNFFFSWPSYTMDWLKWRAIDSIAEAHQHLQSAICDLQREVPNEQ